MTVTATPSNSSRSPLVEPEKTSSDKSLSPSPQPFTDLLTEATSKISRSDSDKPEVLNKLNKKGESTKAVALKSAEEEHPESHSKKSVVVDVSTQLLPSIFAPVPLVRTEAAPVVGFATVRALKEPTLEVTRVSAVPIDAKESKLSATTAGVDAAKHPSSNHLEGKESELSVLAPTSTPHAVGLEDPHPKVIASIESDRVEIAEPVTPPVRSSTLPTKSTDSVANLVFAPEIHISSPVATGSNQIAKPERSREPSIRVSAKTAPPMSEHASPILIRSEPEVVPVWPTHPSVVATGVDAVTAPSHITQPSSHSLDVGALAGAISRPLDEARGGYTVMIAMHPVELGHVQAVVTLHGSELHVVITAQTHVGHNALTHAVETLKTELSRGGINVNVTLQDPGSQPKGGDRAPEVPREVFTEEESVPIAPATPVPSTNQINLIL